MNYLADMEICLGIEAWAGHETPPCDQGGDSPLDSSRAAPRGKPWGIIAARDMRSGKAILFPGRRKVEQGWRGEGAPRPRAAAWRRARSGKSRDRTPPEMDLISEVFPNM